ncbi:glyoxalase superfamily protein, partial [Cribrihabitans sp. XS_ASV171]
MTESTDPTPVAALKEQARRLREGLRAAGQPVTQSQALELLARQHGARDWNTLRARAGNRLILRVGDRVSGRYLGQPFTAELRG